MPHATLWIEAEFDHCKSRRKKKGVYFFFI